jgi:hypothetical protein
MSAPVEYHDPFARLETKHIPHMMCLRFAQNECVSVPVFGRDVKAMHEENDETMTKPECRESLDQLLPIFSSCE